MTPQNNLERNHRVKRLLTHHNITGFPHTPRTQETFMIKRKKEKH